MKVLVMVKATKASESGATPDQRILAEMGKFNEELVKAGILLSAEGLHPSSKGVRVRFSGKNRTVVDGPFAETKELVAGFWLWQVKSMDEAIAWVRRCPNPHEGESEIEIRRVYTVEDFGEAVTPEIQERNQRLRSEVERYTLEPPRLENERELLIAGFSASYTFETRVNIPAQWERFASQVDEIPGRVGNTSYGVCWNYRPNHGFDYLSGVEVSSFSGLPESFSRIRLAARAVCRLHASQTCVVDCRHDRCHLEQVAAELRPARRQTRRALNATAKPSTRAPEWAGSRSGCRSEREGRF